VTLGAKQASKERIAFLEPHPARNRIASPISPSWATGEKVRKTISSPFSHGRGAGGGGLDNLLSNAIARTYQRCAIDKLEPYSNL